MRKLFSTEEINTGRQVEFDYLKGLFMIFIFLFNAFRVTLSEESTLVSVIYIFTTMMGAALYIFVMGFGTVYSGRSEPKELAGNGILKIVYQYLSNLIFIAALLFPYPFIMKHLTAEGSDNLRRMIWICPQFTDVFFSAGVIYLVLALLKKVKCRAWIYPLLGVIMSLTAPLVCGGAISIPMVSYTVKLLIGEAEHVSLTPLYFLSYALIGVGAGTLYRHLADRRRFYYIALPVSLIIAAIWWWLIFSRYGSDLALMRSEMDYSYAHPDIWRVVASLSHICIFAALFYFISDKRAAGDGKKNILRDQIFRCSRHISKYYVFHMMIYAIALGFHCYVGFEAWKCWFLMIFSMIATEILVRAAIWLEGRRREAVEIKTMLIFSAPYLIMLFILIYRVYKLNHNKPFVSTQQFEMVSWWILVVMTGVAQLLFARIKRMSEDRARERTLMDTARDIQDGIVPHEKEYTEGIVTVSAFAQPAKYVGGDFYDIIPLPGNSVGIVMGDVSGKGIPAALFMSIVKTMIRDRMVSGMSPEEVLNQVNDEVCPENPQGMFATVFAGVIDTKSGRLVFANAGHPHPVRCGKDAVYLEPDAGIAIGVIENAGIIRDEVVLKPGEGLLLYTDGATEAVNRADQQYGEQRLLEICRNHAPGTLVKKVADDVMDHSKGLEQFDDLTLLSIEIKRNGS